MFAMGSGFFQQSASGYATLIITGTFPAAVVGVAYDEFVTISGGDGTYTLTGGTGIASGSLPDGMSLSIENSDELHLSGTPTTVGTATFTDSVDSGDGQTATSSQSVSVSIASSVSLSLSMAGADGGTTFTDASANHFTVTANGGIHTQTTGVPAGGSGGSATLFDGVNDNFSLPNDAAINRFETGDFSIECEVYCSDISTERVIASCVFSWTNSLAYNLEIRAGGDLRFYAGDSAPMQIFSGAGAISANTWQVVKVQRVSGTTTLAVDGVSVGTHTGSVAVSNSTQPCIGAFATDNSSPWAGYMRNFVITKG